MSRITVILPNNLGDVIMALPVLKSIRNTNPDAEIAFLVEAGYEAGLLSSPFCDRIIPINRRDIKKQLCSRQWRDGVGALRLLIDTIGNDRDDIVVNLSQHPYMSFVISLINAPDTRGRRFLREGNHALPDVWSQYLYTIPFARAYNSLHATDVYCRIAGVPSGMAGRFITPTDREIDDCRSYLAQQQFSLDRPVAVLQPGAAWPSKRWPVKAFVELGKMLIADGYGILITGAPAERELAESITDTLGESCRSTAGNLTFRESIVLLTVADTVVTGDTAIMHAASAIGTKVVALFGPTNPVETGPYGNNHSVVCGTCPQRPCFKTTCADNRCMTSISPDRVYRSIRNQTVPSNECDSFTTWIDGEVYRLQPEGSCENAYVNTIGAALTRRAFEPSFTVEPADPQGSGQLESRTFIHYLEQMEQWLIDYRSVGDSRVLTRFEKARTDASAIGGIAAFWSALLNIRLNSVPLLNPVAGIEGSLAACRITREQISQALGL